MIEVDGKSHIIDFGGIWMGLEKLFGNTKWVKIIVVCFFFCQ